MTRTTTAQYNDPKMLKRIVARTHPDIGGDHELYIYANSLRERLLSGELGPIETASPCRNCRVKSREERRPRRYEAASNDPDRIPYPASTDFREATLAALRYATAHDDVYGRLLQLLDDCQPLKSKYDEQQRGASYKRLAAIGHRAGMSKMQRSRWYDIARSIPLSDRHAGHLLMHLGKRNAA